MHSGDIGLNHTQLGVEVGFDERAEQAKARVIDNDFQVVAAGGVPEQPAFLEVGKVGGKHGAGDGKLFRERAEAILPAGGQNQGISPVREDAGHIASHTGGRAGNQSFFHS